MNRYPPTHTFKLCLDWHLRSNCTFNPQTIKELQNENWQLKLRIFYLTQSVERFKPEDGFNIKEVPDF